MHTHSHSGTTESKDEEDFDQFLESVKVRQLSLTTKGSHNKTYTHIHILNTKRTMSTHTHTMSTHTHTMYPYTHTLTHAHMYTVAPSVSNTEGVVDFGFWEKAPLPTDQKHIHDEGRLREVDLNLL